MAPVALPTDVLHLTPAFVARLSKSANEAASIALRKPIAHVAYTPLDAMRVPIAMPLNAAETMPYPGFLQEKMVSAQPIRCPSPAIRAVAREAINSTLFEISKSILIACCFFFLFSHSPSSFAAGFSLVGQVRCRSEGAAGSSRSSRRSLRLRLHVAFALAQQRPLLAQQHRAACDCLQLDLWKTRIVALAISIPARSRPAPLARRPLAIALARQSAQQRRQQLV